MIRRACSGVGPLAVLTLGLLAGQASGAADAKPLEFHVTFDKAVSAAPFTGRVYVLLSRRGGGRSLISPDWFHAEPMFARDVKDWKPGETVVVGADALGHPGPLAKLAAGTYTVQAVMDFDRGDQKFSTAEGNGYSKAVRLRLDPASTGPVKLAITEIYHARPFRESATVKLVDIPSKQLSEFHGRPVRLRAAVVLPRSFATDPSKRYPVIYEIPGFGGDHRVAQGLGQGVTDVDGVEMLFVVLEPT